MRNNILLAVFVGLAVLLTAAAAQQPNGEIQRKKMTERAEEGDQTQKNADFTGSQRSALESELRNAQDRAQLAEKRADLAASQQSALETELKNAENRAQLAEKIADLAASQRSALESELKNAEDRAQLAEKNADLATSQHTGQEAELKKAQEKAQLAQQNADLAAGQLTAVETQLKEAQEKVQLEQKIADLVADHFHAKKNRLQNGEPTKKSADLRANQPESGQTQPSNPGLKQEPVPSTQQLNSSVQPAQTSTRSAPAPVRVQALPNNPEEANKGIGFAEATAPIGVAASPTPINQAAKRDQEEGKILQTTPVQADLPLRTPSVDVSAESTPSRAETDRNVKYSVDEQSLKDFVLEYIRTAASNDISTQDRFFKHRVNYYGEGVLALPRVHASIERYHREWPIRNWEPQGEPEFPKVLHSVNPKLYEVLQPFTWTLSNGPLHAQGGATLYVKVWKSDKGEFHIVHVEQRNPDSQSQNN